MPPTTTDALLARFQVELEERQTFMDGLVEAAQKEGRDLSNQEMELLTRTRERIGAISDQLNPLQEAARIAAESRNRTAQLAPLLRPDRQPQSQVEYRTAGHYVIDLWRAQLGHDESAQRLDLYHRAAAHQTTGDNPGLLPEQILGPVINFIDAARPVVSALGVRQLPSGNWSRPHVTQHTLVAAQTVEKGELVSRKMTVGKLPVAAKTFGGYVNVSRQDIDWSQPSVMQIVIDDLAAQYAIETENSLADDLTAGATAGPTVPPNPTADDVVAALWASVGLIYGATKGQGRLMVICSPDVLGALGPAFAPINPTNAQSPGFTAQVAYGQGAVGTIAGLPVYVSANLAAETLLVMSSAAAEVYEDRIGALQVVEPSVLGVQVAYAGYFASVVLFADGIVSMSVTTGP